MLLGAIADDLTGGTDLALTLARGGMRTIQVVGVPEPGFDYGEADAVVVALKSRTIPARDAVALSLQAADALLAAGAEQIVFKYCSTFDSTPEGNIGPVAEALLDHLGAPFTIACPAFPANGRTVFRGHLFVGDALLSESSMRDHPLTPMRDANLVRVLGAQTRLPVGLVPLETVRRGPEAIAGAFRAAAAAGQRALVVDAAGDEDLRAIGQASAGLKLVTGGSGIALGLPENFRRAGRLGDTDASRIDAPVGRAVVLAGSCSVATRGQIAHFTASGAPVLQIDPLAIADGRTDARGVADWAAEAGERTPLIYSSADPDEVKRAQDALGRERAGAVVEALLAEVAALLRERGIRRFLVAGGETSGAVVQGLGVRALRIGPEIEPGVPWTVSVGSEPPVALALKSGNFGGQDFFTKAWDLLA